MFVDQSQLEADRIPTKPTLILNPPSITPFICSTARDAASGISYSRNAKPLCFLSTVSYGRLIDLIGPNGKNACFTTSSSIPKFIEPIYILQADIYTHDPSRKLTNQNQSENTLTSTIYVMSKSRLLQATSNSFKLHLKVLEKNQLINQSNVYHYPNISYTHSPLRKSISQNTFIGCCMLQKNQRCIMAETRLSSPFTFTIACNVKQISF